MQVRTPGTCRRELIWFIRSKRFMSVWSVPVNEMALALFTQMSIPPNVRHRRSTAAGTCSSKRMSHRGQRLAACLLDLLGRGVNRTGQLGMGLSGFGHDGDVGAISGGPEPDRKTDAAAAPVMNSVFPAQ